jgi:Phosphoesterase family
VSIICPRRAAPGQRKRGPAATKITGLFDGAGHPINADESKPSSVGLNDPLWVQLSVPPPALNPPLDVKGYALYLNGAELVGLTTTRFDPKQHALVFRLRRSDDNASVWTALLGSAFAFHVPVRVSVGEKLAQEKTFRPTIQGEDADSTFQLQLISGWRLSIATVVVLVVAGLVFGRARHSTTLRVWKQTLLIITYDEHGGCFDHMPPPAAVPPDAHAEYGFAFDTYGVRVPAVIVSTYIPAGGRVRAAPRSIEDGPPYPFDHTSIIATVRKLFNLGEPLTARDRVVPDLLGALSLALPTNDGPARIDPSTEPPQSSSFKHAPRRRRMACRQA